MRKQRLKNVRAFWTVRIVGPGIMICHRTYRTKLAAMKLCAKAMLDGCAAEVYKEYLRDDKLPWN